MGDAVNWPAALAPTIPIFAIALARQRAIRLSLRFHGAQPAANVGKILNDHGASAMALEGLDRKDAQNQVLVRGERAPLVGGQLSKPVGDIAAQFLPLGGSELTSSGAVLLLW